jgi:hypothetical protein
MPVMLPYLPLLIIHAFSLAAWAINSFSNICHAIT